MNKVMAFLKKALLVESSYQVPLVLNVASIFLGLLSYFFIDKLFGSKVAPNLEQFGVNYFSYALVSTGLFGYLGVGIDSFPQKIWDEQAEGTLEAVLATPTRTWTMLAGLSIWNFIIATLDVIIYVLLGIFVFRVNLAAANILSTLLVLFLGIISFTALGIISASFVVIFKSGNPVTWIVGSLEGIVGGMFFPISVLPPWLQVVSAFFPVTYAVRAMELAVYRGYSISQLRIELAMLLIFSAALLPLSIKIFEKAVDYAKRRGTLVSY